MQGHFDLSMLDTPGLTPELIEAVRREGGDPKVEALLRGLKVEERWSTDNLIYQVTPSYLYFWAISGPSPYGHMNNNNSAGCSCLGFICLTSTASEPSYTAENYSAIVSYASVPDNVGSNPSKLFIDDCIVAPDIKVDPDGRESIYLKCKWLYLPGQATSSVIRSVSVFFLDYYNAPTYSSYYKTRIGRVRIKDSGGNPVTISKAATKSLLVEYTFTMPTL